MLEKVAEINYRYLWHTRKYALMAGGLAILSAVVVIVAIYSQVQTDLTLNAELGKSRQKIASLERKNLLLSQLSGSELLQRAGPINQALPQEKPLTPLLLGLNMAAGNAGVSVAAISLSPGEVSSESATSRPVTSTSNRYDQMRVELQVVGSLVQINQFLQEVESFAPFSTISSISLSKDSQLSANPQFEAELEITSYYFTQDVKVVGDAVKGADLTPEQQAALEAIASFKQPSYDRPTVIQGGGLEDLFGIEQLEFLRQTQITP